ncbi:MULTISPECIES: type VI secretion system membrane subunit TssM [unclassified Neisseria]|uniref:type VI secretion system membrane subunit TssM n=1 Tax=unclassified Neisseria TaxID=2623750 RepID=UPI002665A72C|nr:MULTISPECIES: type VI secretion system membrane subunit TssM [unclassified Neisseria]MDO1510129.1 type VI secretion system membrane subunit TssM [Neisseria sp. MVDL19-042950]MDO1516705.1 type VI secretion system membrane subunit TssM [Neisseria sp. MVDL18-041461]MDO1563852.1 type VI secretion system membrane subunit TssM [Neisseria sp. MVDL20-010259]
MKKLLYFLGSRSLWVMLGIAGLIILVWFIGPLVSVGDIRPLASKSIRLAVCTAIVAIWLAKGIFRQYRESRRNAALLKEIRAAQEPILKSATDISSMSRQFAEMDKVLKNAKFSKSKNSLLARLEEGQYLYQMPWYVVLGAAGSGKTTALKRSGLNFPLESTLGTSVSGLAGTRDCDWFLSDEIVLLDTAGRLSVHDNHSEKDSEDWEEFVSLLKRYRPKQPINGVLVTVGVDDLLGGKTNIAEMSVELRKRIHEMHNKLGIHFPVYLMITKLDLLHGFDKFFAHLTEEQRSQYFGISLSANESLETPLAAASNLLVQIQDKLRSSMLGTINNLESPEDKAAAFAFPEEFERLNQAVLSLLKELSKSSKFEQPIVWRGVYFSSATQTGELFNPALESLQGEFQLSKKYLDSERTSPANTDYSFFLHRLFSDVILSEANLAGENKSWFFRNQMLYWLGAAVIAAAVIGGITLMLNSYANNSSYLSQVTNKATQLEQKTKSFAEAPDLLKAVAFAEQVRDTTKSEDIPDLSSPPLSYRMGLYQGEQMGDVGESAYRRILQNNVMPLISYKLDELLRTTSGSDGINGYNALKAYLMMFNKEHFDAAFMQNWLMSNLSKAESAGMDEKQKKSIEQALNQILSKQSITSSVPYDEELVERRRQEIARRDIATMVLEDTIASVAREGTAGITPVSFSSMGGVQSHLLFRRKSGGALKQPINFIYTKETYIKKVLPTMVKSAEQFFREDNWVLGDYASLSQSKASVLSDAQRLYFDNYIRAWKGYVADLSLVTPKSTRESIQIAKLLSEKNSPLANIIKGISDNTTLNINNQLTTKAGSKVADWLSKAGLSKLLGTEGTSEVKNELAALKHSTPVDDAFSDFHILTVSDNNQEPAIHGITEAINELYVYLVAINVAVEKGVDLPPDDSFVKYKAEVNRLPSPFREMLDNFSGIILKNTDKVVDEKLMSTLEKQLVTLTNSCQDMRKQGYPFEAGSPNSVALESFSNVFGPNGIYSNFNNLSGQTAVLAKSDKLETVRAKNETFKERFAMLDKITAIRHAYFDKGSETPTFDFSVKVLILDPSVESANISYDGKSYVYSHGPVAPVTFTWPSKNEGALAKIDIASPEINSAGISETGVWSVFKLIEKGKILRQTGNTTVVEYNIQGKNVVVEFATSTASNPFDLSKLRAFECM